MANRESTSVSTGLAKSTSLPDVQLYVQNMPFILNRELMATRSGKVAAILKENSYQDVSYFLRDMPADAETFELVARFCHGFEPQISAENVIPLMVLAHYLEMTENHSRHNLLQKVFNFFEHKVLPSWNETIKALHVAENCLEQAVQLGLVDACLESLIEKAQNDPHLLGAPMKNLTHDEDSEEADDAYRPNARRRLFVLDWKSEDLTTLSLKLYIATIRSMSQHGVPQEFVASSVCQYAKRWILSNTINGDESMSIYKRKAQREVLEAVENLLPCERGLVPCTFLFEMLRNAIALEASCDCKNGFEMRIGKQLHQATVRDLLIPTQGYAKEVQYDIECLKRILRSFCDSNSDSRIFSYIKVAELVEEFLAEIASDIDLKMDTFVTIAEMSIAVSSVTERNSDGIYRAIDTYFDKHRYLTESEREEVCRLLDCQKMSPEACEHAAKNEKLPLRVVVQVLFMSQLQLRDTIISKEVPFPDDKVIMNEEMEDDHQVEDDEARVMKKMKMMSNKVMELERECFVMKKELEKSCSLHHHDDDNNNNNNNKEMKKGKLSKWNWKEMKRKFGCITSSIHDCNCQVKKKKVHPKFGV